MFSHATQRQAVAMAAALTLFLLLCLIQPIKAQVYISSSSSMDHALTPAPNPSNPIGWTDAPIKQATQGLDGDGGERDTVPSVGLEDQTTSKNQGETNSTNSPSASPSQRAAHGLAQTQPPTVQTITIETTELRRDASADGPMEPLTANHSLGHTPSHGSSTSIGTEPTTPNWNTQEPIRDAQEGDLPMTGSGDVVVPTVRRVEVESTVVVATGRNKPTQYRPQAQVTLGSEQTTLAGVITNMAEAHTPSTVGLKLKPLPSTTTLANSTPSTRSADSQPTADWRSSSVVRQPVSGVAVGTDGMSGSSTSSRLQPIGRAHTTVTSPTPGRTHPLNTTSTNQQSQTASPRATAISPTSKQPKTTAQTAPTTTNQQPTVVGPRGSTTNQKTENTTPSPASSTTTNQQTPTGLTTLLSSAPPLLIGHGRSIPTEKEGGAAAKDLSIISLGHAPFPSPGPLDPCASGSGPCVAPNDPDELNEPNERAVANNGTRLEWAELSRTLSFYWPLHVFGSAVLFLLLAAGAALGLALSPGMHCPHRGALALGNGLLLLAGAARAALLLLDPYGARRLLPRPVVTALYTLPTALLLWAQAALATLALRAGAPPGAALPGATAQPRPALLGVLAVLQCTLCLAADLLSPALSSVVPLTLQGLALAAGLALCLGFPCLALPRLARAPGKGRAGARAMGRALAACGLLGALCCALHAHACLWLYGLLGDWRAFGWAWWLAVFWARLLELAWGFALLLLASWVFWSPRRGAGRGAGQGPVGAEGELPSPCQSSSAGPSHRHTCWTKIVQSLRGSGSGHRHRKSDSNGLGGGAGGASGGVAGELPNNWAGQERPGADISKSLIRNREPPKDSNRARNQRGGGGGVEGPAGSLLRLQALARPFPQQRSPSGSLDKESALLGVVAAETDNKGSALSLYEFDLRPPSPIDLSRSIDEALHREHLLSGGGSLFRPLCAPPSPEPSPWLRRRSSDPQLSLSNSSLTGTSASSSGPLGGAVPSAVPSRQVTAPPTPTHQGPRWAAEAGAVPSSLSCPVSLHPSRTSSSGHLLTPSGANDDTRPFLTPDLEGAVSELEDRVGRSFLKAGRRNDDSASVSSDIIDL